MKENINTNNQSEKKLSPEQQIEELETKLREAEKKLSDKDKKIIELEEESKNKDELFSVIAHDLRSPFQAILGLSRLVAEEGDSMDPNEMKEMNQKIYIAAEQAFNTTHSLLLWGKTQLGAFEAMNDDINLSGQITKIINLQQDNITTKKIKVINNLNENIIVHADINMLHSVLINILSNCIKFSHEGGEVSISMENNNLIIKDNGVGISPEKINNFFDSIGDTSYGTKGEKGNGLGMNFSMKFMKLMGGDIKVESEGEGKGTTFIITLPTREKKTE